MKSLFDQTSLKIGKLVTNQYSTSFSIGIKLLDPSIRPGIYTVYAFVRLADEIVDSFLDYDQERLFNRFVEDYYKSLEDKISLNPVLNAFQALVNQYELNELVDKFLDSMRMDLHKSTYQTDEEYKEYIVGSAEVVGLMCLKVFVDGNEEKYNELVPYAVALGSAFQKVNFLRDFQADNEELGRIYFPNTSFQYFTEEDRNKIVTEIEQEFSIALKGIKKLPLNCRLGVYVAYKYYLSLLRKLKRKKLNDILTSRTRIPNGMKGVLLLKAFLRHQINVL